MTNAKQKIEIPGEERPLFWDATDEAIVARLRADARKAGIDWTVPKAIGPAAIGAVVDELYPDPEGRKCGPAKQYRIQKLIPHLPCAEPEGAEAAPEAPEVQAEAPEAVELPAPSEPEGPTEDPEPLAEAPVLETPVAPEPQKAPGRVARIGGALAAWRARRSERLEMDPEDEDELPERGWPILIVAGSAFLAVWGGWVGLGEMTGYGEINLLPGFEKAGGDALLQVNTAIALPLGIEAYAAYALRAWLNGRGRKRTRVFAMISGIVALVLGGFGQLAYHLLVAAGKTEAPDEVTIFVSVLPVLCIGAVTALHHMLSMDRRAARRARRARQKESSGNA